MKATPAVILVLMMLTRPVASQALTAVPGEVPDFGDDSGTWANDGECDDMRFSGPGMTDTILLPDDIGTDASDCRDAFFASTIEIDPLFREPATPRDIIWGDDTSPYARDGQCDDLRFTGYYAERMTFLTEDIAHDATDCRALFVKGVARWRGAKLS